MYVLTFISRSGTSLTDLAEKLNSLAPVIPFSATYPDEIQGVYSSAETAVQAAFFGAQDAATWVGIGVGALEVPRFAVALGTVSTSECAGAALDDSRVAVEQARTGSPVRGMVIMGQNRALAEQATGIARLLYRVVSSRTPAENRVISLITPGVRGQLKAVGQALGISPQAVSKTLVRSYWHEEQATYPALLSFLQTLDSSS